MSAEIPGISEDTKSQTGRVGKQSIYTNMKDTSRMSRYKPWIKVTVCVRPGEDHVTLCTPGVRELVNTKSG